MVCQLIAEQHHEVSRFGETAPTVTSCKNNKTKFSLSSHSWPHSGGQTSRSPEPDFPLTNLKWYSTLLLVLFSFSSLPSLSLHWVPLKGSKEVMELHVYPNGSGRTGTATLLAWCTPDVHLGQQVRQKLNDINSRWNVAKPNPRIQMLEKSFPVWWRNMIPVA